MHWGLGSYTWVRKPKTWISVGCGTARDIEFVIGHIKAAGTKAGGLRSMDLGLGVRV